MSPILLLLLVRSGMDADMDIDAFEVAAEGVSEEAHVEVDWGKCKDVDVGVAVIVIVFVDDGRDATALKGDVEPDRASLSEAGDLDFLSREAFADRSCVVETDDVIKISCLCPFTSPTLLFSVAGDFSVDLARSSAIASFATF